MSIESMKAFLRAADEDTALIEGLVAAVGEREGADASRAVADYANAQGYEVSTEDAEQVRQGFTEAMRQRGELSDGDLDAVAGGMSADQIMFEGVRKTADMAAMLGEALGGTLLHRRGFERTVHDVGQFFSKW